MATLEKRIEARLKLHAALSDAKSRYAGILAMGSLFCEVNDNVQDFADAESSRHFSSSSISPHHAHFFLHLGTQDNFKSITPLLERFADWECITKDDGGGRDYHFTEKVDKDSTIMPRHIYFFVYPHSSSRNCEQVLVRTESVNIYEWRCKDQQEGEIEQS